jgi:hypothetical protein
MQQNTSRSDAIGADMADCSSQSITALRRGFQRNSTRSAHLVGAVDEIGADIVATVVSDLKSFAKLADNRSIYY